MSGVFGEARGRLLTELCGKPQTSTELAEKVGTSGSAVRVHLDALRDAGLVDYVVTRRGVGKPKHLFSLTPAAEYLLSVAYGPVLRAILDTMRHQLNGDFARLLKQSGRTLARSSDRATGDDTLRGLAAAQHALSALGPTAEISNHGNERIVSNRCCPLAAITRDTPEVCRMMEEYLSMASATRLRERCERGEHPRCAFAAARTAS